MTPSCICSLHGDALKCFGKNGEFFDYAAYDRLLLGGYYSYDRLESILHRLKYPIKLEPETAAAFRQSVHGHIKESIQLIVERNSFDTFTMLCEQSFFDDGNIEYALEFLNKLRAYEMRVCLMAWKNKHLGNKSFDYSL